MSSWVGLGRGEEQLMQAGTILCEHGRVEPFIQLWKGHERHHNPDVEVKVSPRDRVHIRLVYQPEHGRAVVIFGTETTAKGT